MSGWIFPQFIYKQVSVSELNDSMLIYYHDNLHVLWGKLEEGYYFDWTFLEVYKLHQATVNEMGKRGIPHYAPINDLDKVQMFTDINQSIAYAIEKKYNGFHISVHKQGNEVKIFSEQKKDLTIAFPTLIEFIKKLSNDNFIVDGELVPYDDKGNTLGRNVLMKYIGKIRRKK